MNRRGFLLGAAAMPLLPAKPELVGAEKLFGPHIQAAILEARAMRDAKVLVPHRVYFANQDFFVYDGNTVERLT